MITIAILGRPNVGKSTLFNRLAGKPLAIVDDQPGVTRDRREADGRIGPIRFRIVDTAGLEEAPPESLAGRMTAMSEHAAQAADLRLLLIDARTGVTPADESFARWLRRIDGPTIVVANKCEGRAGDGGLSEAYALGFGDPIPISAAHGEGMADLAAAIIAHAPNEEQEEATDGEAEDGDDRPVQIAIIGRPNAGKSTLLNRLLGEDRALTGPEPGVTRDALGAPFVWRGRRIMLWDTAGMRKRAKIDERLEKMAVSDALRAVRYAHVVILLADARDALEAQDAALARLVEKEGRALVLAANKWDLIEDETAARAMIRDRVERYLPYLRGLPVATLSAETGRGADALIEKALAAYAVWTRRVPTAQLNAWLAAAVDAHPPPAPGGRRIKLRYATQAKARPPTFLIFAQRGEELPESYTRYLVNSLREAFDLPGAPIRLLYRRRANPYAEKKS